MVVMTHREKWTDERLDDLANGVSEVRAEVIEVRKEVAHVREGLGELRAEIKGLRESMEAKFAKVDTKFDAVDKRFDAVDKRFDSLMLTMQIGFGLCGHPCRPDRPDRHPALNSPLQLADQPNGRRELWWRAERRRGLPRRTERRLRLT
jgi:regulator of replication initiation timing